VCCQVKIDNLIIEEVRENEKDNMINRISTPKNEFTSPLLYWFIEIVAATPTHRTKD